MKNILFIGLFLLATSCTKILIRANGYKPPRFQSVESINNFVSRHTIDRKKIVLLKDSFELNKTLHLFSNSPGIIIADSNFARLQFQSKKENCAAPVENLLMHLCEISSNEVFHKDTNLIALRKIIENNENYIQPLNASHYVMVVWNTSMGKNITKVKDWESIVNKQANCNDQFIWINVDFRASWYKAKAGKRIHYKVERK
ncbi:MAG: hypothetical protein ACKOX3_12415 [Bacteroidota bacterium]